uniref:Uncharacterized protein n=1 Tax=Plectus sambesii TaxID=2011161 RepID=A0A914UNZ9_9BILA
MASLEQLARELPSLLGEWQAISSDVAPLESLINLLEQRTSVAAVRRLPCALTTVPELHARLLAKIDMEISDECGHLHDHLTRLNIVAVRMDELYLTAGAFIHKVQLEDFPLQLPQDAMSELDAVVLFMRQRHQQLSQLFNMLDASPQCESVSHQMRRLWKMPYLMRQLFSSLHRDFALIIR